MDNAIQILIADDHYLIAKLLKMMLLTSDNKYKVDIAKNHTEIFNFIQHRHVDILMLDIDMPEIDGIQILKKVKSSLNDIKIIMISNHNESWIIKRSLKLGANGYISKYADCDEIITGINTIMNDGIFLCKNTLKSICSNSHDENTEIDSKLIHKTLGNLSKRELEILKLVVEEYTTKEISDILFISARTVETHRKNILSKMGVKNSFCLVKLFVEANMIDSISTA
jgi:DNA-binding NarL/FixJ family response regulator